MSDTTALGTHTLVDFYGCDPARLNDAVTLRALMIEAARQVGATIIGDTFHSFSPQGVTGVVILAESHLAVHTWPERGYAALDLFTCGQKMTMDSCLPFLHEGLGSARHTSTTITRGARVAGGAAA